MTDEKVTSNREWRTVATLSATDKQLTMKHSVKTKNKKNPKHEMGMTRI